MNNQIATGYFAEEPAQGLCTSPAEVKQIFFRLCKTVKAKATVYTRFKNVISETVL